MIIKAFLKDYIDSVLVKGSEVKVVLGDNKVESITFSDKNLEDYRLDMHNGMELTSSMLVSKTGVFLPEVLREFYEDSNLVDVLVNVLKTSDGVITPLEVGSSRDDDNIQTGSIYCEYNGHAYNIVIVRNQACDHHCK